MKIARGLTYITLGKYTCSVGMLQRHLKAILRFVTKTDAIVFLTRRGKRDLVLMSYQYYRKNMNELVMARRMVENAHQGEQRGKDR